MIDDAEITGVADTALWMAAIRAEESKRPDALFSDPLAALLAGSRGSKILRSLSSGSHVNWGMVIRTSAVDQLLWSALRDGVDTVLNLGAGLDARPYRMDLPPTLRWIEMDLPDLIERKNSLLLNRPSKCQVERIGLDLCDRAARNRHFAGIGKASTNTLVISEGLTPYLLKDIVMDLGEDLRAISSFRSWIQDFDNAGPRGMPKKWARKLRAAPFLFQVGDWFEFLAQAGWRAHVIVTTLEESERVGRPLPWEFPSGLVMHALPAKLRRRILSVTGAVWLEKCGGAPP